MDEHVREIVWSMRILDSIAVREAYTVAILALRATLDHLFDYILPYADAMILDATVTWLNQFVQKGLAGHDFFLLRLSILNLTCLASATQWFQGSSHLSFLLAVADFDARLQGNLRLLLELVHILFDLDDSVKLLIHLNNALRICASAVRVSVL